MNLKDIQNLIKFVAKAEVSEVSLEMDNVKVTIKTNTPSPKGEVTYIQQAPVNMAPPAMAAPAVTAPVSPAPAAAQDTSKYITIKSPMIGTFYRKSAPEKPAFVEPGSVIAKGQVLCVIEAMKLFNEIESDLSGKIVKILVEDASPVEFDQPLFLVEPS
jgi:acetyl-CoA carboxylase biotin carboxyl carrier protein